MNTRAFTLALAIAGFAMFMVYTYVDDYKNRVIEDYGELSAVVVAKADIKEYELIDDQKVTIISVPKDFVSPGSFKSMKEVENTIATVPILKGEQITKPRVTYPGASTGLSREVSAGKRAFAISVDEQRGVAKLLKPGDRVDVLVALDYSGGRKDMQKITTILQDVRVLSTGRNVSNNLPVIGVKVPDQIRQMKLNTYSNYNTVTLELDPFQVQKIVHVLAFAAFSPYLSLRNINDSEELRIEGTKLFDILGTDADRSEAKRFFMEKYKAQTTN